MTRTRDNFPPTLPWSCVESFTEHVCGMPGQRQGCRRTRTITESLQYAGVSVLPAPSGDSFWIVFTRTGEDMTARMISGRSLPHGTGAGVEAMFAYKNAPWTKDAHPEFYAFRRAATIVDVTGWIEVTQSNEGSPDDVDLRSLFGPLTFKPVEVAGMDEHRMQLSIADLINATLDGLCQFRRHGGASLGISMCRADEALAGSGDLDSTTIRFSFVDPADLDSKLLHKVVFGASASSPLHERSLNHLSLRGDGTGQRSSYLTVFSPHTRAVVLPDEVDQSFLRFPLAETSCYLLHWLLIRLLGSPYSRFAQQWRLWADAEPRDRKSRFETLLETSIEPAHDPYTFVGTDPASAVRGQFIGATEYRHALTTIGITADLPTLRSTARFIVEEFGPGRTVGARGFRDLPMYRNLGWSASNDLGRLTEALTCEPIALLEEIHRAMIGADFAVTGLEEHVARSIFPIGEYLLQLPSHPFAEYLILPLWEDEIAGARRPVVFAHVFTNNGGAEAGVRLQNILLPVAATVAHDYYADIKRHAAVLEDAKRESSAQVLLMGAIAHSAGNALRLANAEWVVQMLSEGEPPTHLRPNVAVAGVDEQLSAGVRNLWIGSRAVSFLVAMVEMSARSELRDKFQTAKPYTLDHCIAMAKEMVTAFCDAMPNTAPVRLEFGRFAAVTMPIGYIDAPYVETLLFEIFGNVSKYGRTTRVDGKLEASARIDIRPAGRGASVHITNWLKADETQQSWSEHNGIAKPDRKRRGPYDATFLDFAQGLGKRIGGIGVSSRSIIVKANRKYETVLTLGPIRAWDDNGETRIVTPVIG